MYEPKSKIAGIPQGFMAFTHTKKVQKWSFIMDRIRIQARSQTSESGSDQKGPDPTGYATLFTYEWGINTRKTAFGGFCYVTIHAMDNQRSA
jgi:hypothetical protein